MRLFYFLATLLATLCFNLQAAPSGVSYEQMIQLLEAQDEHFFSGNPEGPFPQTHAVNGPGLLRALSATNIPSFLGGRRWGGDIGNKLFSIMSPSEWSFRKDPPGNKYLHPRGVTFVGDWEITERSNATGLFSQGTRVKAVCRFSSGTSDSVYIPGKPRIFGASCMLFPGSDLAKPVLPLSILTLDSFGFDGAYRNLMFEYDPDGVNYFTSFAPAVDWKGPSFTKGTILARMIFDAIDPPNAHRPLDHISAVNGQGEIERSPHVPFEVRFYPQDWGQNRTASIASGDDFRKELLGYDPKQIGFDIVAVDTAPGLAPREGQRLGTIRFERAFINPFSELEMRFFHITHRMNEHLEPEMAHLAHNPHYYDASFQKFVSDYERSMTLWGVPSRLAGCAKVLVTPSADPCVRSHQAGALKPLANFSQLMEKEVRLDH
jgi:hypothetical protein